MSLDPSRFSLTEYVNSNWTVTVEAGTSLDDVLGSAFFSNVAAQLHPYDRINVRVDTGEWYAELLVLQCGRVWTKLIKLSYISLVDADANAEEEIDGQYSIEFKGPHNKWSVIRKSDKEPIKQQCANKQEAQVWLASHLLTL